MSHRADALPTRSPWLPHVVPDDPRTFPKFAGFTFTLCPRPGEAQLKPLPPEWLVKLVEAGKRELGKGKRYRYYMEIPGAKQLARYNMDDTTIGHKRNPSDADLQHVVEAKFTDGKPLTVIAREQGLPYQTMKKWLVLAEQRGLIDAHQKRVTTELGPLAITALEDALRPSTDIRTRVKAAVAVQQTLEKMNAYVARREEKIEAQQKEDTLDDIIARMRKQRARESAVEKLKEGISAGANSDTSDTIDAEFADYGPDPNRGPGQGESA